MRARPRPHNIIDNDFDILVANAIAVIIILSEQTENNAVMSVMTSAKVVGIMQ